MPRQYQNVTPITGVEIPQIVSGKRASGRFLICSLRLHSAIEIRADASRCSGSPRLFQDNTSASLEFKIAAQLDAATSLSSLHAQTGARPANLRADEKLHIPVHPRASAPQGTTVTQSVPSALTPPQPASPSRPHSLPQTSRRSPRRAPPLCPPPPVPAQSASAAHSPSVVPQSGS